MHFRSVIRCIFLILISTPPITIRIISAGLKSNKVEKEKHRDKKIVQTTNVNQPNSLNSVRWIFMHYHKTGHDIVEKVVLAVTQSCEHCSAEWGGPDSMSPRIDIQQFIQLFSGDILVLHAPDMQFSWEQHLNSNTTTYRILHFVREPYDMLLSGYFYHSQIPPPPTESWISDSSFHPCSRIPVRCLKHSAKFKGAPACQTTPLAHYAQQIAQFVGNESSIVNLTTAAEKLCYQLYDKYRAVSGESMSYSTILQKAYNSSGDHFEGIRIETLRAIVNADGGDLLRMGANAYREMESQSMSKRVFLSQFPVNDRIGFKNTFSSIFSFLMRPADAEGVPEPFWKCITPYQAVILAEKAAFLGTTNQSQDAVEDEDEKVMSSAGIPSEATTATRPQAPSQPTIVVGKDKLQRQVGPAAADAAKEAHLALLARLQAAKHDSKNHGRRLRAPPNEQHGRSEGDAHGNESKDITDIRKADKKSEDSHSFVARRYLGVKLDNQEQQQQGKSNKINRKSSGDRSAEGRTHSHVTSAKISPEERADYIQRLKHDAVLGPLLDLVAAGLGPAPALQRSAT